PATESSRRTASARNPRFEKRRVDTNPPGLRAGADPVEIKADPNCFHPKIQLSLYVYPRDVLGILLRPVHFHKNKAAASSGGAMSTNIVVQSTASMPVPADDATSLHDVQLYSDDAYLLDS